ncbi:hypothetical protein M231_06989 [Tremella mesenterica]|uniref:Atos-like conserved domain-containing protein n=1 Tax=Tremella mesenterica TaxID=5217 RepID=A0A4Q1BAE0_TREME|nr:hypothetical protein M231_06989 [Tremella mesenterica]
MKPISLSSKTIPTPSSSRNINPNLSKDSNQTPSPPLSLSRSHPLAGSFPLSLLHSRMSLAQPHSPDGGFTLHIGSLGKGRGCPPELRGPEHIKIPFSATYYDLEEKGRGTPWVANVDLEQYYFTTYTIPSNSSSYNSQVNALTSPIPKPTSTLYPSTIMTPPLDSHTSHQPHRTVMTPVHHFTPPTRYPTHQTGIMTPPMDSTHLDIGRHLSGVVKEKKGKIPDYPGYRVAPVGQLQILVKSSKAAIKVFLIPYDLRGIPIGGRLLARERTYVSSPSPAFSSSPSSSFPSRSSGSPGISGESLRYACQLQFVCLPSRSPSKHTSSRKSNHSSHSEGSEQADVTEDSWITENGITPEISKAIPIRQSKHCKGCMKGKKEEKEEEKSYYVSKNIKLVFTSSPPEKDEIVRVERMDEVVLPSPSLFSENTVGVAVWGSSPDSTPQAKRRAEEWKLIQRRWEEDEEEEEVLDFGRKSTVRQSPRKTDRTQGFHPTSRPVSPSPTISRPASPLLVRPRGRRGSTEDRELSERLRAITMPSE